MAACDDPTSISVEPSARFAAAIKWSSACRISPISVLRALSVIVARRSAVRPRAAAQLTAASISPPCVSGTAPPIDKGNAAPSGSPSATCALASKGLSEEHPAISKAAPAKAAIRIIEVRKILSIGALSIGRLCDRLAPLSRTCACDFNQGALTASDLDVLPSKKALIACAP